MQVSIVKFPPPPEDEVVIRVSKTQAKHLIAILGCGVNGKGPIRDTVNDLYRHLMDSIYGHGQLASHDEEYHAMRRTMSGMVTIGPEYK